MPSPLPGTIARRWLDQQEAADHLRVTTRTLRNYAARGLITPRRIRGSRLLRYDLAELDAMLAPIPAADGAA